MNEKRGPNHLLKARTLVQYWLSKYELDLSGFATLNLCELVADLSQESFDLGYFAAEQNEEPSPSVSKDTHNKV